jgi:hypothetical protein
VTKKLRRVKSRLDRTSRMMLSHSDSLTARRSQRARFVAESRLVSAFDSHLAAVVWWTR